MEVETLGNLILLIVFLVAVMLIFGAVFGFREAGAETMDEYICWGSNLVKARVNFIFPGLCREKAIDEAVSTEKLAGLMRRCWWMYGGGDFDLGPSEATKIKEVIAPLDVAYTCYAFQMDDETDIADIIEHLRTHNKGSEVEDLKKSDLYYLEKGSKGKGVCFDREYFEENRELSKDAIYYLLFLDDRRIGTGKKDMIVITKDSDFRKSIGRSIIEFLRLSDVPVLGDFFKSFYESNCYDYIKAEAEREEELIRKEEFKSSTEAFYALYNALTRGSGYPDISELEDGVVLELDIVDKMLRLYDDAVPPTMVKQKGIEHEGFALADPDGKELCSSLSGVMTFKRQDDKIVFDALCGVNPITGIINQGRFTLKKEDSIIKIGLLRKR